jgi:hypothetical protein
MAIVVYNKLPWTSKTVKYNTLFNKKIKQYLINKCFYNISEYLEIL